MAKPPNPDYVMAIMEQSGERWPGYEKKSPPRRNRAGEFQGRIANLHLTGADAPDVKNDQPVR